MAKGKGKGSAFERAISKQLSLWWTRGEREDIFWRSQTSGARATVRAKQGKTTSNQHGDIQASDPIGQPLIDLFSLELKAGYNKFTIKEILDGKKAKPELIQFFEQAQRDCDLAGCKGIMVITKQDRREPMVYICHNTYLELWNRNVKLRRLDGIAIRVSGNSHYAYRLKDFLEYVDPDKLK